MKTYLITGGAGFIGSNFIHYMFNKYKEEIFIINIDNLTYAGNLNNLKNIENLNNYKFIKGDICDAENLSKIFKTYDIEYVVNFAAESHVDRSIEDPSIFVKTNILGTQVLIEIAKKYWKMKNGFKEGKKYIQISTDEVYGSLGEDGYFTEKTLIDPHSPYSSSKASADLIVKAYYDTYRMPINITRCSNNYGPYQFPEKLIPLIINNCIKNRDIPIYGDGKNVRDWLYVEDHCAAIDLVINEGAVGEIYNIGGNNEKQNIEIVKYIIYALKHKGLDVEEALIRYVEDRKGHDRRYAIDSTKIREELRFNPSVNFNDGMLRTIEWYLNNKDWLGKIVNGDYMNYYKKFYGR
ncbi:dTDP-glucose 4,6-dehydratase [Clostridiaceae bacterium UIB06]|uniref:dTDP-glucose 4,6-dehydratase n=1 Tax=Clostridium thailandense TaxID=2794346 RepID=A0A949TRZ2_9CLOT|nr:dTDP-glucose 4,6-dehydratase [Clostridium thailandense]MBV7272246.1 dTDP-glucose 4,6-dehydratase [Clostridium thailandense]MCH5137792.1 dTDP-glucose 4,6-dehydratase [Clostridiaceae bacterium UIB06]